MPRPTAFLKDSEVVDYFLTNKTVQGCTPKTLLFYRQNLRYFREYLNRQEIPLLEADQFQIMGFLAMRTAEVAPATLHIYFRVLRTFYNWCIEQGFRPDNPLKKVPQPRVPHKVLAVFSPDQLNDLLAVCGTTEYLKARNTAILLVMLDTAIRRAEVVAMKLDDIDWPNSTIKIHGKGRKERYVKFSTETGLALKKYLLYHHRQCPETWLTEEGQPLKERGLGMFFRRLKDRAGIRGVRCSPHTVRHTSACMFLNKGSVESLQVLLGHSSIKSTEIYIETVRSKKALSEHVIASPVANLKRK